jgi:predicted negative regulator of RcsB-dependent stress response
MLRPSMRVFLTAAVLGLLAAGPAAARRHDPEKLPEIRIHDLHYGDALFYFYQDEDLETLTRLLAYEHWQRMPHHDEDAQLLVGGLYLQLGMHNEAGEIFERLLTNDVPSGVRNVAWFRLAQVWYARGYLDKADAALRRVNGRMSADLEAQKELLFANVLMHEGRYDEAIRLLSGWRGGPVWSAYARFNLGVALVRNNRLPDADPFLTGVGTMLAPTAELAALRDRANLALGFAYLQANQPDRARRALARVRLNGPYSNKALLGSGWADAALGNYQDALTPWLELRHRDVLDSAVQESYLAVPYAFSKLNANAQSAEYYESAVSSFATEKQRLDAAIARIGSGEMVRELIARYQEPAAGQPVLHGAFTDLKSLPNAPEAPYLYAVLAGHDFQEGLKNYRDLVFMGGTLENWGESMDAFADMIGTRERAYAERLPRADALLSSDAVGKLEQRNASLEGELRDIESHHDVAALGTEDERAQWARVQRLEAALAGAPDTPENAETRARLKLVKGVLYYRLEEAYAARLWQEHRGLKDLNLALHEAQSRWIRVERARRNMPVNTGEFATRVAALRQRIETLQTRLAAAEEKQGAFLAQIAVHELEQQKDRLAIYQVQARFALASMYDRAANPAAGGKPGAPAQKGAAGGEPVLSGETVPMGETPPAASPTGEAPPPPAGETPPPEEPAPPAPPEPRQ